MSRPTLFIALITCLTLLCANTALAQGDQPPPPPPLGDSGDEPTGIDTDTTPPPPATTTPLSPVNTAAPRKNAERPVVRANGKNMGMFFKFGGFATMSAVGEAKTTNALITNEVGVKLVFSEKFMLPIFFGMGVAVTKLEGADESDTDWNMSLGVGVEYHFKIWRRISPFLGGIFKFGFSDPAGDAESGKGLEFRVDLGPALGIEYYIADRISLTASYMFLIGIAWADSKYTKFGIGTKSAGASSSSVSIGGANIELGSGGNLTLTAYF